MCTQRSPDNINVEIGNTKVEIGIGIVVYTKVTR